MTLHTQFDAYAEDYDAILSKQLAFFDTCDAYFAEYKVDILCRLLAPHPRSVLDFGCGVGRSIGALRKAFPSAEIVGCDVSEKSLERARTFHSDVVFHDPKHLVERERSFDLVFVAGVLHHVSPCERTCVTQQIAALSATGGAVVAFEHNPLNPVTRRLVSSCPFDDEAVLLGPSEMMQLMRSTGLVVAAHGYTLFFPSFLRVLRPLEPLLKHLPLGGQYFVHATRADTDI